MNVDPPSYITMLVFSTDFNVLFKLKLKTCHTPRPGTYSAIWISHLTSNDIYQHLKAWFYSVYFLQSVVSKVFFTFVSSREPFKLFSTQYILMDHGIRKENPVLVLLRWFHQVSKLEKWHILSETSKQWCTFIFLIYHLKENPDKWSWMDVRFPF